MIRLEIRSGDLVLEQQLMVSTSKGHGMDEWKYVSRGSNGSSL